MGVGGEGGGVEASIVVFFPTATGTHHKQTGRKIATQESEVETCHKCSQHALAYPNTCQYQK